MHITRLFILFFLITGVGFAQAPSIQGEITDLNGIKLSNVNIHSKFGQTTSDSTGFYLLKLPANKKIQITYSSVNSTSQTISIRLKEGENKIFNIILELENTLMEDIELKEKSTDRFENEIKLNIKDLDNIGTANGGVEALVTAISASVSSNSELSSQYAVRGGNYDENLVYVNGLQIYRPFLIRSGQQEGLSFLNPDMVSEIKFSAGGFDAKYGDKLSSVLDITYKKATEFKTKAYMSFVGAGVTVENPFKIKDKTLSFIGSFRYKSNSFLLNSLDTEGDYRPQFTDLQTYVHYPVGKRSSLSLIGNYSNNQYLFIPKTRTSEFGTVQEALQLKVFFDGQEVDKYENGNIALQYSFNPEDNLKLQWQLAHFRTLEQEFYDIEGQYILGQLDNSLGSESFGDVVAVRGVGGYLNHARNELYARVTNFNHRGTLDLGKGNFLWGLDVQHEIIDDNIREWQFIDSVGFSTNYNTDDLELFDFIKSSHSDFTSNRIHGFAQYERNVYNSETKRALKYKVGLRANHWDVNGETFVSPRAQLSYKPNWTRDVILKASAGSYNQSPFYRELRNRSGELNLDIKSQKSAQYVLGLDYALNLWDRPFRLGAEVYYKQLWDVIPYELENLQIRYLAKNNAKAYSTGLELRLNGEFVEGLESYVSIAFMKSEEDIQGDDFGYIPKPTDRRVNFNIFFQDYFQNNPNFKVHLKVVYGSSMAMGPPRSERKEQTQRMIPAYRRVDFGLSRSLKREGQEDAPKIFKNFKSLWLGAEVLNLFGISNTVSFLWITDANQVQYAVPNFLTSRIINLKLIGTF